MTEPNGSSGRGKCGGRKRQGEGYCTRPAGWGTDHPGIGRCKLHAGSTPNHVASAAEEQAQRLAAKWAVPVTTTAMEALTAELARCNGMVLWLEARCAELDDPVWSVESRTMRTNPGGGAQAGVPQVEVTQAAKPHPYVAWLERERDRLARIAADMTRLGLEARIVRLSEAQGAQIAQVMRAIFADMSEHLCPVCQQAQRELIPQIVPRRMRELAQ